MPGGYSGRTLEIDLTTRHISMPETDRKAAEQFLGGRGMGIKALWDRITTAGLDPLSPANPLMFWTSPLSGLPIAGASRVSVVTKAANTSPENPELPQASTVSYSSLGGHFGPTLKRAGFDALILSGRAEVPLVLVIDHDKVSFRPAADVWGQAATKTIEVLAAELGPDYHLLAIGPAGENGVRFAGIVSDVRRTTARGGAGAVMGAKNLKAIAVKGHSPMQTHKQAELLTLRRDIAAIVADWSNYAHWRRWGATPMLLSADQAGMLTTKNFREGSWQDIANLSVPVTERQFWLRHRACAYCPLKCVKIGQIADGPWRGVIAEGPGHSAGAMLGANCCVSSLDGLMALIGRCDELGLDPIAAGNVLGFVMDLYESGVIGQGDLDGLAPVWGHVPTMMTLLERIAFRQGVGDLLAGGVKKAARDFGAAALPYAMHVKGQEMAGWNVPASPDFALVYGTANRGASHQEGATVQEQHRRTFLDAACVCRFVYGAAGVAPYQRAVSLATGMACDDAVMLGIGERIWNLEKLFNAREGFRRSDDKIPARFASLAFTTGPKAGAKFSAERQEEILDRYYTERGWDVNTSLPTPAKLQALGLDRMTADK